MSNNSIHTENDVLRMISEKEEGSYIKDDKLYLPEQELTVWVNIISSQQNNKGYSAQLLFFINHPYFEQPLVESCAGVGNTENEAIEMCMESFYAAVLLSVQSALGCDCDEFIESDVMGEKHIFRVPCSSGTLNMGGQFLEKGDLWTVVQDVIPQYLGCKRVYWVKLFAAMAGGEVICEARVNGIVYSGLTEYMKTHLSLNGEKHEYSTYKAFVVLIQQEKTFKPCPYTLEQVEKLTSDAIAKLSAVNSQESHDKAINDIINSAPVESLGWELAGLIPEMYCMMVLNFNENDSVMYYKKESGESDRVMTSRLSSYDAVARGVFGYISQKQPTEKEHLSILASSGMFKAVNKALNDGAKMEDLRCSDIMYSVGEDYRIY